MVKFVFTARKDKKNFVITGYCGFFVVSIFNHIK